MENTRGLVLVGWLHPLTFVLWVWYHWGFPLSVHIIIPVLWLCSVWVCDVLGLIPLLCVCVCVCVQMTVCKRTEVQSQKRTTLTKTNKSGINLYTYIWFCVLWVIYLSPIIPVIRFPGLGIRNSLGSEEVPILFESSFFLFLVVDFYSVSVVRSYD